MTSTVFVVDDSDTNLIKAKKVLEAHYRVFTFSCALSMISFIEKITPDMILLDIEMPEMDGYEAIKRLKDDARYCDIPVIFLTAMVDERSEIEGFDLGAVDYISKPFSAPRLLKRVACHLLLASQKKDLMESRETLKFYADHLEEKVYDKTREVFNLQNAVLATMSELVEFRDHFTGDHVNRTQLFLNFLIEELFRQDIYGDETVKWELDYLLSSAQLHDVGKIAITDQILNKPDRLTREEFDIMKTHVAAGVTAIEKIMSITEDHAFLRYALLITKNHHEKWDGSGYPDGLRGENIPLEGRLMAIADVYDALISERPYKRALPHEQARKIIEEGSGTHFDPQLVRVFQNVAFEFARVVQS